MVQYTDPSKVAAVRIDDVAPTYGHTVTGYGGKIPTAQWVHYAGRWHRVYVMIYSNSGTAYILVKGERLIIDTDTGYRFRATDKEN